MKKLKVLENFLVSNKLIMNSLSQNCFQNLEQRNISGLAENLPPHLYEDYVNYLQFKNFPEWKKKIRLANLEANLEDIEVEPDMYMGDLTYHIFVKKKVKEPIEDEDESDMEIDGQDDELGEQNEFELIHEFEDETGNYYDYLDIARMRNLLE